MVHNTGLIYEGENEEFHLGEGKPESLKVTFQ